MNINDYGELKPFFDTFQAESDRACGVLAGVLLDSLLETLLRSVMLSSTPKKIFSGSGGVLGTFSGKTDMAYYLGHISKDEYDELNIIRSIRNDFAHAINHALSFSTSPVVDRVQNLQFARTFIYSLDLASRTLTKLEINAISNQPRKKFEISVGIMTRSLDLRIKQVQQPTSPEGFTDMVASALTLQKKILKST
jgi:hypothetical protein